MGDSDHPPIREIREIMSEVGVALARGERREAQGWIVVCVDLAPDARKDVSWGYGVFDEPEQALVEAGRLDAESKKEWDDKGEPGWRHVVVPLYKPESGKSREKGSDG